MNTILCNICGMKNDQNSVKCEHCKGDLLYETNMLSDDWEREFRFIEEAEMQGNVYEISDLDDGLCEIEPWEIAKIDQDIKNEPEIQIEPENENEVDFQTEPVHSTADLYNCSYCTKSFKREAVLKAHLNAEHKECNSDEETVLEAEINKNQKNEVDDSYSEYLDNGFWKCTECSMVFSVKFDFKMHKNQHKGKGVFQCDICKAYLSNSKILMDHKKKLHTNTIKKEKRFRCSICGELFSLQVLLSNHKKTHTEYISQLQETANIKRVNGRLKYICKTCDKISSNKSRHEEHLRVHTKERPFKCTMCGAEFTAASSLVIHMRLHSDERRFKCEICNQTYRQKKILARHLLRHSGQRPFKCRYCDKTFSLNSTKMDHERLKHTGETPYQCVNCEKCFKTSFLLNGHRRSEHAIATNTKPRVRILVTKICNDKERERGNS